MAKCLEAPLTPLPHTSHPHAAPALAPPHLCPTQTRASQRWSYTRRLFLWFHALFVALLASLLSAAASPGHSTSAACSGQPLPTNCTCSQSPGKSTNSDFEERREELLDQNSSGSQRGGSQASATALFPWTGGLPAPQATATSVRLFYEHEGEHAPVGKGSLISGRYLLVDLLHPPQGGLQTTSYPEGDGEEGGESRVHLRIEKLLFSGAVDEGESGSTGLVQISGGPATGRPSSPVYRLPAQPLLLPPGKARGALVAAVVSVHSELVVARRQKAKAEGFCIDPFIFLRRFSFWIHRPLLPSPESSANGSSTSDGRYKVFGRLGGGAYGEVWRAVSLDSGSPFVETVLKRMRCKTSESLREGKGGLGVSEDKHQQLLEETERMQRGFAREVFFGLWLRGLPNVSRFLEVLAPDLDSMDLSQSGSPTENRENTAFAASPAAVADAAAFAASPEEAAAAADAAEAASAFLPELSKDALATVAHSAKQGCDGRWLVFANEGSSLTHLFFVADPGGSGLLEPSALWWHLKASARLQRPPRRVRQIAAAAVAAAATDTDAPFLPLLQQLQQSPHELLLFLRSLLQQLLLALEAAHRRHVTHRDVKLENVLLQSSMPLEARLADWGSAVSNNKYAPVAHALKALLGDEAPSLLEETDGYQPPEVLIEAAAQAERLQQQQDENGQASGKDSMGAKNRAGSSSTSADSLHRRPSYDMWGVGLIFLKLALGTPTPLEAVESRRSAKLARESRDKPIAVLRRDLLISALGDLCLVPWESDRLPAAALPTAVVAPTQNSFLSSLKAALVSATDGMYSHWRMLFCGDEPERPLNVDDTGHESNELIRDGDAAAAAETRSAAWRRKERRLEELFELLSRVRGEVGGGEVIVRQQLAVQRQHRGAHAGGQIPFDASDDVEAFKPHAVLAHHHADCNATLFAEILKARDPAGVGVPNPLARDLLRKLLSYDPQERLTAEAALQHPWFAVAEEAAGAVEEPKTKLH